MADDVEIRPDEQHGVPGSEGSQITGRFDRMLLSWSRLRVVWSLTLTLPASHGSPLSTFLAEAVLLLSDVRTIHLSCCLVVHLGCPVCLLSDTRLMLVNRSRELNIGGRTDTCLCEFIW